MARKENRVDQFRFAARKLGDKGQGHAVVFQPGLLLHQQRTRLVELQPAFVQPGQQRLDQAQALRPPFGVIEQSCGQDGGFDKRIHRGIGLEKRRVQTLKVKHSRRRISISVFQPKAGA
ncbi:hypothetical protein GALL_553910 [mine drainage metagenome]|uniref:Uncharacterized protein n=1 Tax=mine drainage metagenome TaxID=410659 RepID=A0A1J5NXZ2_9ZZZZ